MHNPKSSPILILSKSSFYFSFLVHDFKRKERKSIENSDDRKKIIDLVTF
jgi:hypothetical protein